MFDSIKKWLVKRPIINLKVESLSPDAVISVLKVDRYISRDIAEHIREAWEQLGSDQKVIVIGLGQTLEQLSDADLRKIGLIRADFGSDDEPQYLGS